jgi:hypothetical protein
VNASYLEIGGECEKTLFTFPAPNYPSQKVLMCYKNVGQKGVYSEFTDREQISLPGPKRQLCYSAYVMTRKANP